MYRQTILILLLLALTALVACSQKSPEPVALQLSVADTSVEPGKIDRLLEQYEQRVRDQRAAQEQAVNPESQIARLKSIIVDLRVKNDALRNELSQCQKTVKEKQCENPKAKYTEEDLLYEKALQRVYSLYVLYNTIEVLTFHIEDQEILDEASRTLESIAAELALYNVDPNIIRNDDFGLERGVKKHIDDSH